MAHDKKPKKTSEKKKAPEENTEKKAPEEIAPEEAQPIMEKRAVQSFNIHAFCQKKDCNGEYVHNGVVANGNKFQHVCTKCGNPWWFSRIVPAIVHEEVTPLRSVPQKSKQ